MANSLAGRRVGFFYCPFSAVRTACWEGLSFVNHFVNPMYPRPFMIRLDLADTLEAPPNA
jgi:hypothetical protein